MSDADTGYDAESIAVLRGLRPVARLGGHVIPDDEEGPEPSRPDSILRTVYLTARSDVVLRQLAAETGRTRGSLIAEIASGMAVETNAASDKYDSVMRLIQLPREVDLNLRERAGNEGLHVQHLIRRLVDAGTFLLSDRLSDRSPRDPGAPA